MKIETVKARRSLSKILTFLGQQDKEVSVLFADDEIIREINKKYLDRDKPTNVISFSMNEGEYGSVNTTILGDIVISADTALRESKMVGLTLEEEIDYLMIHGVLHLLGYEHEYDENNALKMKKIECEVFFKLNKYFIE